MSSWFRVGIVSSAHGIKGAVKVFPTTEDPQRFLALKSVHYSATEEDRDIQRELSIERVQFFKNLVILSFKEVKDRNEAEAMRGGCLWISDEEALPLAEDEFYIRDFMGATVKEESGELLGEVEDILFTGSNEVLCVRETSGNELLIPVIHECIVSMDAEKSEIIVHLLKGLRT
ncbi:MAG: 16S rRNA processing protein RimM [Lachnospiraceae bacterium]|jgi:16S rRNA processing protein RimM|nr:16S rRNA processing protein RimM [Lachnospiraceae bacterium]